MKKDKEKIYQLEMIIDRLMCKLEENENEWYFMIERNDFEECQRDYEHYEENKK